MRRTVDANPDANAVGIADTNANRNTNADSDGDANTDSDRNADSDGHADANRQQSIQFLAGAI